MVNLRVLAEADLGDTLEGEFKLPVILIDPDGDDDEVVGQILYDQAVVDIDAGATMTVNDPVVILRRSSLNRIPLAGETWGVQIPIIPDPDAVKETFIIGEDRNPEGGASIGFIRLYLQKADQT